MDRRHEAPRRVDLPETGYFLVRLVKDGPDVAAEILFRRGLWCAVINGIPGNWDSDWTKAEGVERVMFGRRIDEAGYQRRLALSRDPTHPCSRPWKPVDLTHLPPLLN